MALDNTAVVIPGTGYAFINPAPGTAPPAATQSAINALDLTSATLTTGWANLGHTSRGNNVSIARDGGDVTVLGSWQNTALRTITAPVTWSVTINALQITNEILNLYFGGGVTTGTDVFAAPDAPVAQERALWIVLVDGATRLPVYLPRVSFAGSDAVGVDPENFLEFALTATVLKQTGAALMSLYKLGLGGTV